MQRAKSLEIQLSIAENRKAYYERQYIDMIDKYSNLVKFMKNDIAAQRTSSGKRGRRNIYTKVITAWFSANDNPELIERIRASLVLKRGRKPVKED